MQRGWLTWLLRPLHFLMWLIVRVRQHAYSAGWFSTTRLSVPVIVVGNRIAGGAGKTPTVIALVEHLQQQGWTPGILSRGYGRHVDPAEANSNAAPHIIVDTSNAPQLNAQRVGDEPWLMWLRTQAPMGIGSHRANTGQALLAAHPDINILVCDDGLQHWALSRDLEIVVFDARGAGNGLLLPAGPLREPLNGRRGPGCEQDAWVLYNAPKPSTPLTGFLSARQLASPVPLQNWWQTAAADRYLAVPALPSPQSDKPCWAVAGIAQPERFFESLRDMGYSFTPCPLPDHAKFDTWPWPETLTQVIVTEKDAVKIAPERLQRERPETHVWVVPMTLNPAPAFWQQFDQWLNTRAKQAPTLHP